MSRSATFKADFRTWRDWRRVPDVSGAEAVLQGVSLITDWTVNYVPLLLLSLFANVLRFAMPLAVDPVDVGVASPFGMALAFALPRFWME